MPVSVDEVVRIAQTKADEAGGPGGDVNVVYAQMAAVPPHAALIKFSRQGETLSFGIGDAAAEGKKIFEKFEGYVRTAVCDDFHYCNKRAEVDADLKKYLPDIVKAIVNKIPISGQLPGWLVTILELFHITA